MRVCIRLVVCLRVYAAAWCSLIVVVVLVEASCQGSGPFLPLLIVLVWFLRWSMVDAIPDSFAQFSLFCDGQLMTRS